MAGPEEFGKLIEELQRLNRNLEEGRRDTQVLLSRLKDVKGGVKAVYALAKQINIFNQIMLQVSKRAGHSAMFKGLLDSLMQYASAATPPK